MPFEPTIVGFLCASCAYAAADHAGAAKHRYPANLRVLRVTCSGRVSPRLVLRAFAEGADGVLVGGCRSGECHYHGGNHQAAAHVALTARILDGFGLARERLRMAWISADEGERFAAEAREMTDRLRALGPRTAPAAGGDG